MYWDGNYIFVAFLFNLQKHYTTDDDNYIFVTLLLNLLQLIYTTDDDNYIFVTFLFNLQSFFILLMMITISSSRFYSTFNTLI